MIKKDNMCIVSNGELYRWCKWVLLSTGFFYESDVENLYNEYAKKDYNRKHSLFRMDTYVKFTFICNIDSLNKIVTVTNTESGKSGIARFNYKDDMDFIPFIGIAIAFYRYVSGNVKLPEKVLRYLEANQKVNATLADVKTGDIFKICEGMPESINYLCIEKFNDKMFVTSDMMYFVPSIGTGTARFNNVERMPINNSNKDWLVVIISHDKRLER